VQIQEKNMVERTKYLSVLNENLSRDQNVLRTCEIPPLHRRISVVELGHLLNHSGLTYPEVSSKVYHDSFCPL